MPEVKAEDFVVGGLAMFTYHGKLRMGEVETVGNTFVRLKFDEPHPVYKTKFQSFRYEKITVVK